MCDRKTKNKTRCPRPLVLRSVGHRQWPNPSRSDQVLIGPGSVLGLPGPIAPVRFVRAPEARNCGSVPAGSGIVISVSRSPRAGDGVVQRQAGCAHPALARVPPERRALISGEAGGATPPAGLRAPTPREPGCERGAAPCALCARRPLPLDSDRHPGPARGAGECGARGERAGAAAGLPAGAWASVRERRPSGGRGPGPGSCAAARRVPSARAGRKREPAWPDAGRRPPGKGRVVRPLAVRVDRVGAASVGYVRKAPLTQLRVYVNDC